MYLQHETLHISHFNLHRFTSYYTLIETLRTAAMFLFPLLNKKV